MIITTQRPSADIITPLIRSNCPARIALKVDNASSSGIIMGDAGAELLAGYGDAYVKDGITGELVRVQGPYLSNDEIAKIFEEIRDTYERETWDNWKQELVDRGDMEWAEEYDESVPMEQRHLSKPRRRRGF